MFGDGEAVASLFLGWIPLEMGMYMYLILDIAYAPNPYLVHTQIKSNIILFLYHRLYACILTDERAGWKPITIATSNIPEFAFVHMSYLHLRI